MYAIIETGGKQYRVSEGDVVNIARTDNNGTLNFDNVLMVSDGENIQYGTPYLSSAKVSAEVLAEGKDRKMLVFKQKIRKNYRRLRGHKQQYTKVRISKIELQ